MEENWHFWLILALFMMKKIRKNTKKYEKIRKLRQYTIIIWSYIVVYLRDLKIYNFHSYSYFYDDFIRIFRIFSYIRLWLLSTYLHIRQKLCTTYELLNLTIQECCVKICLNNDIKPVSICLFCNKLTPRRYTHSECLIFTCNM
jgi:hypothetical protein